MNITGIIAEYNPFHNGHAYQLMRAREETDADYLIIVMSGNFMQRGTPALLDKYTRAKTALIQGADLVLELPPIWSSSSAEYFAEAGISLLTQLGCVSALCYGCETPDSDLFGRIAALLRSEPPQYRQLLSNYVKKGIHYALAREKAILDLMPDLNTSDLQNLLQNPNNILAIEYQKALLMQNQSLPAQNLQTTIKIHPILRQGAGYHSKSISESLSSAAAIRRFLAKNEYSQSSPCSIKKSLTPAMPDSSLRLLIDYLQTCPLLYEDDCSQMLHYCLIKGAVSGFADYADCSADLSNKICRNLDNYTSFTDFCTLLKTKDLAYSRISRVLLHILLDLRQCDYDFWRSHNYMPYARVLGFRKDSERLFSHLKKHSHLPLLTRAADARKILTDEAESAFFKKNMFADSIYRALVTAKGGRAMPNEYRQKIQIV